jgi:hypothetical protein
MCRTTKCLSAKWMSAKWSSNSSLYASLLSVSFASLLQVCLKRRTDGHAASEGIWTLVNTPSCTIDTVFYKLYTVSKDCFDASAVSVLLCCRIV